MDSVDKNTRKINEYIQNLLFKYSEIRGKEKLLPSIFWDAIVVSASDENQKKAYEKQIAVKKVRREISSHVTFHVFADPPGFKIGCGGSTMFVLDELSKIYGNALCDMRILLIPAGGYSQRLPNLTALGKLFCHLPFKDMAFQMIDLILAIYLPFLKEMPPGVFLASSDAIISYSISDNDLWTFRNDGFTALAHPSPISIGLGHGVYVLPPMQNYNSGSTFMSECLRVLQKPTIEEMHEKGAITSINSGDGDQEVIFSDSTFFFDYKIIQKLVKFYNTNKPLRHELSSYGDFLQPLGTNASPSYILEKVTDEELALKKSALYRNLFGTNLSILVLKNSLFHHLGTMKEYLDSFCFMCKFSEVFPVHKFSFSCFSTNGVVPLCIDGTVVHSIINPMCCVPEISIIEYCDINISINVGKNCILSNIEICGYPIQRLPFDIPDDTLIHTAAVENGFVTIACNVNSDIKKLFPNINEFEIDFFGKKLKNKLSLNMQCFSEDCSIFSLWNAKIFPLIQTKEDSFKETLKIIHANKIEMEDLYYGYSDQCIKLVSLSDIIILKNTEKMIEDQTVLYNKIKSVL